MKRVARWLVVLVVALIMVPLVVLLWMAVGDGSAPLWLQVPVSAALSLVVALVLLWGGWLAEGNW